MVLADEPKVSKHAQRRMRQRRIEEWEVFYVLDRGDYAVGDHDIRVQLPRPGYGELADADHLRLSELVVVLSPDERVIKTTFWREEPGGSRKASRHLVEQKLSFTVADALGGRLRKFSHSQGRE